MIEQHEFEPVSARVAVATCMDEALTFKKGAIVFGLGGTAVSTPARGNLELFTPEHRKGDKPADGIHSKFPERQRGCLNRQVG